MPGRERAVSWQLSAGSVGFGVECRIRMTLRCHCGAYWTIEKDKSYLCECGCTYHIEGYPDKRTRDDIVVRQEWASFEGVVTDHPCVTLPVRKRRLQMQAERSPRA